MPKHPSFSDYYNQYLDPESYEKLLQTLEVPTNKSLRVNTSLYTNKEFLQFAKKNNIQISPVSWSKIGFYYKLPENLKSLGALPENEQGLYYLQDSASMIPSEILEPKKDELILDMCSAPGGKRIHISNLVRNNVNIIANEVEKKRSTLLCLQLKKYGLSNVIVTTYDSSFFAKNMTNKFDKILIDAPCSGEGMRERGLSIIKNFNYSLIKFNAKRQQRILTNAFQALKKGGTLVYSTCALSYDENEGVVDYLLKKFPQNAKLKIPKITEFPGISKENSNFNKCIRIWPFYLNTNGFFVAKIVKTEDSPIKIEKEKFNSHQKPSKSENWKNLDAKNSLIIQKKITKIIGKEFKIPENLKIAQFKNEYWLQP